MYVYRNQKHGSYSIEGPAPRNVSECADCWRNDLIPAGGEFTMRVAVKASVLQASPGAT